MRQCIAGNGSDSTSAVLAYLAANRQLYLANLYLIGEAEDPSALWLTDWPQALTWGPMGTFVPAVIKCGTVSSKIGLDVSSLDLTFSPANLTFTNNLASSSPLRLAQLGFYDNWRVRVWRCIMPTAGDANTYGAYPVFGGRIASAKVDRTGIQWTVNSWLDVINQQVPSNIIENTNTMASFSGAVPPFGFDFIPQFSVTDIVGDNIVIGSCTGPKDAGEIFGINAFWQGALVFNYGPNATLGGYWAIIAQSEPWPDYPNPPIGGYTENQFTLYGNLPWPPTAGVDTFFVTSPPTIDQSDQSNGVFYGFPYVPSPETGV
jgi:hypothetical protein